MTAMCRCYALSTPLEAARTRFRYEGGIEYPPRPDIRPGEPMGIVRLKPGIEASGRREFALVRWGLVPHWVKDLSTFGTLPNARAETILDKPSFRTPMRHRRCIIPADGWTVWTGPVTRKVAHRLEAEDPSAHPLAFAGLWDHWLGSDGSELETAAIVTVPATEAVAVLDERMPVMLDAAGVAAWLDVRGVDPDVAARHLRASELVLAMTPPPPSRTPRASNPPN